MSAAELATILTSCCTIFHYQSIRTNCHSYTHTTPVTEKIMFDKKEHLRLCELVEIVCRHVVILNSYLDAGNHGIVTAIYVCVLGCDHIAL